MADNLTTQTTALSTVPTASTVATDDVGGAHYQRMKLADGTDGSSTMAKVTSEGNLQTITLNRLGAATVLDAQDEALTVVSDGYSTVRFQITALSLDELSRLRTEVSVDGGTSWIGQDAWWDDYVFGTGVYPAAELSVASVGHAAISGTTHVRCRLTNYTSGSVTLVASLSEESVSHPLTVLAGTDGTDDSGISRPVNVVANSLKTTLRDSTGDSAMDDANDAVRASVVTSTLPTGAATSALQTQPGVDIGDVTVNNAAGASAVNIQDGGNVITVDGTVAVTGVSTAANQTTEIGHLATIAGDTTDIEAAVELIDDTVQVLGTDTYSEATSKGITLGAVRRDADTTLVGTTNEFTPLQVDANGRLKVEAFSGETLPVSGTVSVTEPVSIDDNGGNISIDFAGTVPPIGAGTEAAALRVTVATDSTGVLSVDDNGSTLSVDGTVTANQGTAGTAWEVVGDVAASVAAPANPVVVGAQMETMADSAPATRADADGDAVKFATTDGALFVIPTGAQIFTSHNTGVETGTQIHAAPGSGLSCYITAISFSIGAATASSVTVLNNGGADIWGPHYLEAISGRGLHVTFPTPLKGTANTRIDVTTTGAATQTVDIQGFIAPG